MFAFLCLLLTSTFGCRLLNENVGVNKTYQQQLWLEWKKYYHISYSPSENRKRLSIFVHNCQKILIWNELHPHAHFDLNEYSSLTAEEFQKLRSSVLFEQRNLTHAYKPEKKIFLRSPRNLPKSIDWVKLGHVTEPSEQGKCGCCYAISGTSAIESRCSIVGHKLQHLSVQEVVDCTKHWGNHDCKGGEMVNVYRYSSSSNVNGLCTASDYPFHGKSGKCKSKTCTHINDIRSWKVIPKQNETRLKMAVSSGPVAIGMRINDFFQLYDSGILSAPCGDDLNHAALVVGYGEENGINYWKIKNSWGKNWGENGYIRICRDCNANGSNGQCGIVKHHPTYPVCA